MKEASSDPVVLITGGAGFLGHSLVEQLLEGDVLPARQIRVFDLSPLDHADARVRSIVGDVRDAQALVRAARGVDVVLHCASIVDWGRQPVDVIRSVNVGGTRNAIDACLATGARALVMTSTLDVVYDGNPIIDGDESIPYPPRHRSTYCASKAEAERLVLAADGHGLRSVAIRPVSIYGEGDPYHVSSLIHTAVSRRIVRVGNGRSVTQHVYVGNVAHAHLLAARALIEGNDEVAGKAYFVTDSPPENFFDFLEPILADLGYRMLPWSLALPRGPMYAAGLLLEKIASAARPVRRFSPLVTRFAVDFVCLDLTFVSTRAERLLGYAPRYSRKEAHERTVAWFRAHGATGPGGGRMPP